MISAAETVLAEAKRAYEIATRVYWAQRDSGGIVALDPEDIDDREEIGKGRKFKPVTPAGKIAFGNWQKCKAELDAAHNNRQFELGSKDCPVCGPDVKPALPAIPDSRLPQESE